jgi:hypothetical protein
VSDLDAALEEIARGTGPLTRAEIVQALRAVAQFADALERHRATLTETVKTVNALEQRLLLVDALPDSALFGALIRLTSGTFAARTPIYVGNGLGQPLTKIVPTSL